MVVLLIMLYGTAPSRALTKDLVINADNVNYQKEKNLVEASGSVEVKYKDVNMWGKYVRYNTSEESVKLEQGFILDYGGISLEGESLNYNLIGKEGVATQVAFAYGGVSLRGKEISIGTEKFDIQDAFFSTCNLKEPHYSVTAREILLYPRYGWMVAYWGFFWLGKFPIVPMPTYIYDMRAEERGGENLAPFPEISSNDQDGFYINQRMAWHLKREFSGTYSLNYATKKGLGGGGQANYIINDDNAGELRLYGNTTDGLWGGVTHSLFFGPGMDSGKNPSSPLFFSFPESRHFELRTTLSYRERINYQRVSLYPDLLLKIKKMELLDQRVNYDAELQAGMVGEENNLNLLRGGGALNLYKVIPLTGGIEMNPWLLLDGRFYANGGRWLKSQGGIELAKPFSERVSVKLGYRHYFSVDGQSPFNYEMYRFSFSDRITSGMAFVIGETGVGITTSHFLPGGAVEDIDYTLFFKMHCYNLGVSYRSLRREFSLGFALAGR